MASLSCKTLVSLICRSCGSWELVPAAAAADDDVVVVVAVVLVVVLVVVVVIVWPDSVAMVTSSSTDVSMSNAAIDWTHSTKPTAVSSSSSSQSRSLTTCQIDVNFHWSVSIKISLQLKPHVVVSWQGGQFPAKFRRVERMFFVRKCFSKNTKF